jgi:hypothetical protein
VTNARPVPIRPNTANSGMSRPRTVTLPGPRYGRSRSGTFSRSAMSAMCATENDSIAPNA